jgi:CheY-like chemotaxis protein
MLSHALAHPRTPTHGDAHGHAQAGPDDLYLPWWTVSSLHQRQHGEADVRGQVRPGSKDAGQVGVLCKLMCKPVGSVVGNDGGQGLGIVGGWFESSRPLESSTSEVALSPVPDGSRPDPKTRRTEGCGWAAAAGVELFRRNVPDVVTQRRGVRRRRRIPPRRGGWVFAPRFLPSGPGLSRVHPCAGRRAWPHPPNARLPGPFPSSPVDDERQPPASKPCRFRGAVSAPEANPVSESTPPDPWVLVVDSDQSARDLLHFALRAAGFGVLTAESGEEAVTLLAAGLVRADAAVVDRNLPGAGGEEVAAALRRLCPGLPVLLATGDPPPEGVPEGCAGLIRKPFPLRGLVARLRALLPRR